MAKELTNKGISSYGDKKRKFRKLKIFGIIFASILLIFSITLISGYSKYKSSLMVNLNQNGIQDNSLQTIDIGNNSIANWNPVDRTGLANSRIKIRNSSGTEVISLDHNGTIVAVNINATSNLSAGQYTFSQWIGSSASRILQGWFNNIDVSSTANATTFYENGNRLALNSSLSNYPLITNLAWNQSGSNIFLNTPAGNVGIGITSPGAKLDIQTETNTNGLLIRETTDTSLTHNFYIDASDNGQAIMYANGQVAKIGLNTAGNTYFNGGNVGIGTTTPSRTLDVNAGIINSGYIQITGNNSGIMFNSSDIIASKRWDITNTLGDLRFTETGVAVRMIIQNTTGNIGIGTTSPSQTLDVRGQGNFSGVIYYNNNTLVNSTFFTSMNNTLTIQQLYNSTASMIANLSFNQNVLTYNDTLFNNNAWNQSGTNVILNKIGSNVGIGTSNPNARLTVNGMTNLSGNVNITGDLFINGVNVLNLGGGVNYWGSNGSNIYNLTAKIGIGVLAPAYSLEVANSAEALNISGMLYVNSSNVWVNTLSPTSVSFTLGSEFSIPSTIKSWYTGAGINSNIYNISMASDNHSTIGIYGRGNGNNGFNGGGIGVYGVGTSSSNYFGVGVQGSGYIGVLGEGKVGISADGTEFNIFTHNSSAIDYLAGRVGINKQSPLYQLDVAGNVSVDNFINLKVTSSLPACGTSLNGSLMRNNTGVYGCGSNSIWLKIF